MSRTVVENTGTLSGTVRTTVGDLRAVGTDLTADPGPDNVTRETFTLDSETGTHTLTVAVDDNSTSAQAELLPTSLPGSGTPPTDPNSEEHTRTPTGMTGSTSRMYSASSTRWTQTQSGRIPSRTIPTVSGG